jgi:GTP-binding protein EngB required for normal cell division/flagellar biosynthesis chaperone FliJ
VAHTPLSIDELIEAVIGTCREYRGNTSVTAEIQELTALKNRLFRGEIRIALIGQFNRGKSTFLNRLMGAELLPTSVLPLTSISTEIKHAPVSGYAVHFTEGDTQKKDCPADEIARAILPFVAEKHNPKNKKNVDFVEVFHTSPLLNHGTVFIDTPGFGSTHIHNTRATLDLLKECDAVLFMLSADLPITQIELNFLKTVLPHISRLFFIYNKIDILTEEDRIETTEFIRDTISTKIPPRDFRLYEISALQSQGAYRRHMLTLWQDLSDFIQKEKYYSLAQALDTKYTTIVNRILFKIGMDIKKDTHQIQYLENKYEAILQEEEKISALITRLEDRFYDYRKTLTVLTPKNIHMTLLQEIDKLGITTYKKYRDSKSLLHRVITLTVEDIITDVSKKTSRLMEKLFEHPAWKQFRVNSRIHFYPPSLQKMSARMDLHFFIPEQENFGLFSDRKKKIRDTITETCRKASEDINKKMYTHLKQNYDVFFTDLKQRISDFYEGEKADKLTPLETVRQEYAEKEKILETLTSARDTKQI